jgi:hypothetical protein
MCWIKRVWWRTILWMDWMNFKSCSAMAGANPRVAIQSACGYRQNALFKAQYLGLGHSMPLCGAEPGCRTQPHTTPPGQSKQRIVSVVKCVYGLWRRCSGVRGKTGGSTSRMTVVRACAPRVKVHLVHVDQLGRRGLRIGCGCCFAQTDNMRWAVLDLLATAHARIGQVQQ